MKVKKQKSIYEKRIHDFMSRNFIVKDEPIGPSSFDPVGEPGEPGIPKEKETVDMDKFNTSSPWVIYATKVCKLFEYDDDVTCTYDESENILALYVCDSKKHDALNELFPTEKMFGNVTMRIKVIPANPRIPVDKAELIAAALKDNPHFSELIKVDPTHSGASFKYLMFYPNVVQFFSDNLGDPNGKTTMLVQDLAKDIFGAEAGIYFCSTEQDEEYI